MIIICALFLLCAFSCRSSDDLDEIIIQKTVALCLRDGKLSEHIDFIQIQLNKNQPNLYLKVAKKIVLEALKLDPIMSPNNIIRTDYTPTYKLTFPTTNVIQQNLACARIQTIWAPNEARSNKPPKIFLFYRDTSQLYEGIGNGLYSFNNIFYTPTQDALDMAISPDGYYTATLTKYGNVEISRMHAHEKTQKIVATFTSSAIGTGLVLNPVFTSGAIIWLENGESGYWAIGKNLYYFSFDSSKILGDKIYDIPIKNDGNIFLSPDAPARIFGKFVSEIPSSTRILGLSEIHQKHKNYIAIDYIADNQSKTFLSLEHGDLPDKLYSIETQFGNRTLPLRFVSTDVHDNIIVTYENLVQSIDIALARNLKDLKNYYAATLNEDHNVLYLFKNNNQNIDNGFVPIIERVSFIPDYIKDLITEFNLAIKVLSEIIAGIKKPHHLSIISQLRPKADLKTISDSNSIDLIASTRNMIPLALSMYQKARAHIGQQTKNSTQVMPQTQTSQETTLGRLYTVLSSWYSASSNSIKTNIQWLTNTLRTRSHALWTRLNPLRFSSSPTAVESKIPHLKLNSFAQ